MSATKERTTKREQWWHSQATESERFRSLRRRLAILICFSQDVPVLSVTDIADEVGMSRSMTHHYLLGWLHLVILSGTRDIGIAS